MVYAKPKRLQPADAGVVLNIEWFMSQDGEHPDLNDQVMLPAGSIDQVTPAMIEDAIARRLPVVEVILADAPDPPTAVTQILGRVVDADQIASAAAERKRAVKGKRT